MLVQITDKVVQFAIQDTRAYFVCLKRLSTSIEAPEYLNNGLVVFISPFCVVMCRIGFNDN